MLAPQASSAFVCIRCELQLARRRLPAYYRRTSHTNFSTSLRLQHGADELEALSQAAPSTLRITREREPLDRIRKRKGRVVRETSARLGGGIKRLGDDAEILVLREVGDNNPLEVPVEPEQVEPLAVPDILGSLQKEHEALTPEDIRNQLESLRPKIRADLDEPLYVPLKAFIKLIRDLTKGFTQQQLSQFYSAAKNLQQAELRKEVLASLKGPGTTKRTTIRSNWQPGITSITKRLPGVDVNTRNKRVPVSKQLLVDRIIRDLWKLVPLEEVEAHGEIELSLKPWQITMLNSGGEEKLLNKISGLRKAQIQIHQQHSILRITANKTTCEYAADDIEEALQNIETKKLQLKPWIPWLEEAKIPEDKKLATLYTEEDFRMVTSLTRASIQRMDNANTLVIRGLDTGAVAEAERTLIRLLPFRNTTIHTIDTQDIDAGKGRGILLPTSHDEKSLEQRYRSTNLGRWSLPVARSAQVHIPKVHSAVSEVNDKVPDISAARKDRGIAIVHSLCQLAKEGQTAFETERTKYGTSMKEPKFRLSADFGQALFPLMDTASGGESNDKLSSSSKPLFTSSVPGLTGLLSSAHTQGLADVKSSPHFEAVKRFEEPSLVYDFVAAPEQSKLDAGQTPPTLRIQMRTSDSGGKATLHKVSFGFQEHIHTVLLPGDVADVRFTRYARLHYRHMPKNELVEEWVEEVGANIASGERLTAPNLTVQVPKYTIIGAKGPGAYTVNYLFSGVRFRQIVNGKYHDEDVSYSTVQSSKLGAQGGALSMYYRHEAKSANELLQDHDGSLTSFVEKVLAFAATITEAAGQTQPVAKLLRPRSNQSGRKQRRLEEQVATATEKVGPVIRKVLSENVVSLLDDAVKQSSVQSQAVRDNDADKADVHNAFLEKASFHAIEERTTASSEHAPTGDIADSPSAKTKSE